MASSEVDRGDYVDARTIPLETEAPVEDRSDGLLLVDNGVTRFPPPKNVFDKGARRTDNNLFWSSTLLLNYTFGTTILNTGQVFSRNGILAATLLYIIAGRCTHVHAGFVSSVYIGSCSFQAMLHRWLGISGIHYQAVTAVERRLFTGRGARNELYSRQRTCPRLETTLTIKWPYSRCEDQCGPKPDHVDQPVSACDLGVGFSGIDGECGEYG